ncbi:MAG: diguanylate cyclase [Spirochaetia bacterium]|nr:diguanylate cyclase [Spirochaetia bacterium]
MPSYIGLPDAPSRKTIERILQPLSKEAIVPCKDFAELIEFVQLHQSPAEIEMIVTAVSPILGISGSLQAFADLEILTNVPILILLDRSALTDFTPGSLIADVASMPVDSREVQTRMNSLLRLRNALAAQHDLEHDFREMSRHSDDLIELRDRDTGLASHGTLLQFLSREWRRSLRYDRPIAAIAVDVIADSSALTDVHFRALGDHLRECLHRAGDVAGRIADRRFVVVLSETDYPGADHVASRIRSAIQEAGEVLGKATVRTGSASMRPREMYQGMKPGASRTAPAEELLLAAALRNLEQLP